MKSFIAAILIITAILFAVFINGFATDNITSELISSVSRVDIDIAQETLDEFLTLWQKYSFYFNTTIHQNNLDDITAGIDLMLCAVKTHDRACFELGKITVCEALKHISDISSLSLKNIL